MPRYSGMPPPSPPSLVSIVLAVRNEARYLPRCLAALACQEYPGDRIEVLIADGGSTDGTAELARAQDGVTVIDNPAHVTPAGFNAGIRAARGDVIIILGARAEVAPDFVAQSVAALARTGADAVGGVVDSRPWDATSATARAIALALRSPFGAGGARYRYATTEQVTDTVNYGAYRREVFTRIGLFDEALAYVEDDEFNYRLRAAGGRLALSPKIRVTYYSRPALRALWRQQYHWGRNKPKVARRHPGQMRPRQAIPAAFVATVLLSSVAAPCLRPARQLLAVVVGMYGAATVLATVLAARSAAAGRDMPALVRLPLAFAAMHLGYGAGMLVGLARRVWREDRGAAPAGGDGRP